METAIDALEWLECEATKLWKAADSQPFVQPGGKLPPEYDRAEAVQGCVNRLRTELIKPRHGAWPMSKMPTCPDCGWPPMQDPEDADKVNCNCPETA